MKFLLDAQLPPSLKQIFISHGHDCIHTIELELGNETPDKTINALSVAEQRILITKDSDFFHSFIVRNAPYKLILVKLGNTGKDELIKLFSERFKEIIEKLHDEYMIILSKDQD